MNDLNKVLSKEDIKKLIFIRDKGVPKEKISSKVLNQIKENDKINK